VSVQPLVSQLLSDDAELRDMVEAFVVGLPHRVEELRQAYAALDWQRLHMLAHRLKGAAGSYGYPDLSRLATTMELGFALQQAGDFSAWMKQFEECIEGARAGLAAR
jgi:HPt (histidine-containing phosphotransfer) domain-containing protein